MFFNKKPEAAAISETEVSPEVGTTEAETPVEINKPEALRNAFNTKGFLEFLSKDFIDFDIHDSSNIDRILEIHAGFVAKEEVERELKSVAKKELTNVVGFSIEEIGGPIETYLERLVFENPNYVLTMQAELQKLKTQEAEVATMKTDVENLKSKLIKMIDPATGKPTEVLTTEEQYTDLVETAKRAETWGWLGLRKKTKEARALITTSMGAKEYSPELIPKYLDAIKKQFETSQEVTSVEATRQEAEAGIAAMKTVAVSTVMEIDGTRDAVTRKISEKISAELNKPDLKLEGLNKQQSIIDSILEYANEGSGILDDAKLAELQVKIDSRVEDIVITELLKTLGSNGTGQGVFTALERGLNKVLNLEGIGSAKGEAARDVVVKALAAIINDQATDKLIRTKAQAFAVTNNL